MAVRSEERGRGKHLPGVRTTDENHRATPFELFFDLVHVFAITQITPPVGILTMHFCVRDRFG